MSLRYFLVFCCSFYLVQASKEGYDYESGYDEFSEDGFDRMLAERLWFQWIILGTKWCGIGNKSEHYNDLGLFAKTDMCCREHDHCDDFLESGETRHNLKNEARYTRLNCECDLKFYNCLKGNHNVISYGVGRLYFNLLRTKCYKFDFPIIKCKKYLFSKCLEYEVDETAPKVWEWFDVPFY